MNYANTYGIMILPEVDGPAHVASGFEWGSDAGLGDLVVCDDPNGVQGAAWLDSGLGPPTGQLNLGNPNIYPILSDIYEELTVAFPNSNYFHIGGDEIIVGNDSSSISCYNNTNKAVDIINYLQVNGYDRNDQESFYQLWQNYTKKVSELVINAYESNNDANKINKLHIWGGSGDDSSGIKYNLMTRDDVTVVLPPDRYNIQVWDTSDGSIVPDLINKKYQVVLSNTDYVYLDCGNAGWAHPGGYWCQPYHEWYHIYEYITDVVSLWRLSSEQVSNGILGSETLIWSEMIDDTNIEQKLWPRTAALAEALWGRNMNNKTQSWYAADPRMQQWREVLKQRGISVEPLQTKWCSERGAYACTVNAGSPQ